MYETWELISNVTEVIGIFLVPVLAWMTWTLITQGKQIIVLEQMVNDSLNQRMRGIEQRVGGLEEKIDDISENVTECKMVIHDSKNLHGEISQKFDILISRIEKMDR